MKRICLTLVLLVLGSPHVLEAQQVTLTVDLDTNAFTMTNEDAMTNAIFDAYRISSSLGVLDPTNWLSLEDQFIASWNEAGTPSPMLLAETRRDGFEVLVNGTNVSLGSPYNPGPAAVAAGFGADLLADLQIETFNSSTGVVTPGDVVYVGEPEYNNLVLNVNTDTGNILLENESPSMVAISAYGIFSSSGSLDTGWNGLRDTETGWNEIGSVSAFQLGETNPLGALTIASGATYDLGTAFQPGMMQDVSFDFLIDGTASGFDGRVKYVAGGNPVSGDFNSDGMWNCTDINALTSAIASGSTDLFFDMNGDGNITLADVTDAGNGWLAVAGAATPGTASGNPYLSGDANLDDNVNGQDFVIWNNNKFTTNSNWCDGDFNADGFVNGADFVIWNTNKFMTADGMAAVPEPTASAILLASGFLGLMVRRRH